MGAMEFKHISVYSFLTHCVHHADSCWKPSKVDRPFMKPRPRTQALDGDGVHHVLIALNCIVKRNANRFSRFFYECWPEMRTLKLTRLIRRTNGDDSFTIAELVFPVGYVSKLRWWRTHLIVCEDFNRASPSRQCTACKEVSSSSAVRKLRFHRQILHCWT